MSNGDNTAQDERENREITQHIDHLIAEDQRDEVLRAIDGWEDGDVTELLIQLPLRRARKLYDWLPADHAADVIEPMNADLRAVLMESSEAARIASIVEELDEDDAVELLNDLPDDIEERVLEELGDAEEQELRERLKFDEDSAGGVMSNKFVVVLDDWNVGTATLLIRRKAKEIEKFY